MYCTWSMPGALSLHVHREKWLPKVGATGCRSDTFQTFTFITHEVFDPNTNNACSGRTPNSGTQWSHCSSAFPESPLPPLFERAIVNRSAHSFVFRRWVGRRSYAWQQPQWLSSSQHAHPISVPSNQQAQPVRLRGVLQSLLGGLGNGPADSPIQWWNTVTCLNSVAIDGTESCECC